MRSLCRLPFVLLASVLTACAAAPRPVPSQTLTLVPPVVGVASSSPAPAPLDSRLAANVAWESDIEKRLRAAMGCPWDGGIFTGPCRAMDGWDKADALFAEGKADATLVTLLESRDLKVRLLACENLDKFGKVFRTDPALAGRVVAVVERERQKDGPLAALLGRTAATIDVERTGVVARLEAIVQGHPLVLVRSYLLQSLGQHNPTSATVRRLVQGAIHDPSSEVRTAAAGAYRFVNEGGAESCAFWAANLAHPDGHVVAELANGMSQDRCADYHDRLLTTLERSDVALTPFSSYPQALEGLCNGSTAKPRDRLRAAAIARRIVANPTSRGCIPDSTPVEALDAVLACDPKSAKAYLRSFLKGPDGVVKERAGALYKQLP